MLTSGRWQAWQLASKPCCKPLLVEQEPEIRVQMQRCREQNAVYILTKCWPLLLHPGRGLKDRWWLSSAAESCRCPPAKDHQEHPRNQPSMLLSARRSAYHGVHLSNHGYLERLAIAIGLLLANFRESLMKWEFALDWKEQGWFGDWYLHGSYLDGGKTSPMGKEAAITPVSQDRACLVGYFCGLDNVHAFVCVQTWLQSSLVSVLIHPGHRVALSDVVLWTHLCSTGEQQGLAECQASARVVGASCLFPTVSLQGGVEFSKITGSSKEWYCGWKESECALQCEGMAGSHRQAGACAEELDELAGNTGSTFL